MPQFVILEHDWPTLHWDLFLEQGPSLRAFRLLDKPRPGVKVSAEPSADHRLFYLDYEGPVSGNRGRVVRVDWGAFQPLLDDSTTFAIDMQGQLLVGRLIVRRTTTGWVAELPGKSPAGDQ